MSTWNMPPGVTTNDIPGNRSDDRDAAEDEDWEDEEAELAYERWKADREDYDE